MRSRDVILVRGSTWSQFLPAGVSFKAGRAALMGLSEESFSKFSSQSSGLGSSNLVGGTLTRGDLLWVPAGWLVCERVHSTSHHLAFKVGSLATSLQMSHDVKSLASWTPDEPTKSMADMLHRRVEARLAEMAEHSYHGDLPSGHELARGGDKDLSACMLILSSAGPPIVPQIICDVGSKVRASDLLLSSSSKCMTTAH